MLNPLLHQTRQKVGAATAKKPQKDPTDPEETANSIHTRDQAVKFLTDKDYLNPGNPVDLQTLAHALSQIGLAANKMPKALTDSITAIVVLINDYATQQTVSDIVTAVKTQLQEHLDTFTSNVETMRDAVEHVTGAMKEMTGKLSEFNDGFHESAEHLVQATQELTEKAALADNNKPTNKGPEPGLEHYLKTYASATKEHIPPAHEAIVAKGYQSTKQIIMRKDLKANDNTLANLSEIELVAKANTTIDLMGTENFDMPPGTSFVGAKKLHNGNIMYLLNTHDAGRWINQTEVQKAFMESYGGTANIQSNLYYVIAEFVPTTFIEDSTFTHLKIEENSNLGYNTLIYSKYIKPAHLCNKNQKVAHVIFGFNSRHTANTAIQSGIIVEGKHVNTRKKLTEPKRCLKCQKFGHYVPDCDAKEDTCARCKRQHRTSSCNITDMTSFCCSNCIGANAKGHGAADRNCPAFKTETEKVHNRVLDNKYKYFPTSEPKTWSLLNEPDNHTEQHQTQPQSATGQQNKLPNVQNPSGNWQTTNRSRTFPPLTQQDRHYVPQPRTDTYIPDKGWPSRPAQTTLDSYVSTTHGGTQTRPTTSSMPHWQPQHQKEPNPGSQSPPTIEYA